MKISIGLNPLKSDADIVLHPIKYKDSIAYEPSAEEAVIALIAKYFTYNLVDDKTKKFFDEMDDGYLYSESNFDEFDLENIKNRLEDKNEIIVGKDLSLHPRKDNIFALLELLKVAGFEVFGIKNELEEIDEVDTFDGSIVYCCDDENNEIIVSKQFKIANKIRGDKILVDGVEKNIITNDDLKGVFGIIGEKTNNYPFKRVKIENV
jgi:hypothetical protein